MTGMPYINTGFLVLCRNIRIASQAPTDPPAAASKINVFSGILHLFFFALCLSLPYIKNVITFIKTRQTINNFMKAPFPPLIQKVKILVHYNIVPFSVLDLSFFVLFSIVLTQTAFV
jgi:hypothetical protein